MSFPSVATGFVRCAEDLTDVIEGYNLGPIIGQGSFGKVRVAENLKTGQQVAIKILRKDQADHAKIWEEVRIQRRLDHQHVVRLYDVIETENSIMIVMELVEGEDLVDYITRNVKLGEVDARRLFLQIISGVEHCHSRKIVHRDLKPENIMMDADLNVKIADFGFAAEVLEDEFLTDPCGSPNYAAPELLRSNCSYQGPEADVWSCGVILYALLCRSLPFDVDSLAELSQLIKKAQYTVPGYVSAEAKDLLSQMLTVDPAERISISQIWKHRWVQESTSETSLDFASSSPSKKLPGEAALVHELPTLLAGTWSVTGTLGMRSASTVSVSCCRCPSSKRFSRSYSFLRPPAVRNAF